MELQWSKKAASYVEFVCKHARCKQFQLKKEEILHENQQQFRNLGHGAIGWGRSLLPVSLELLGQGLRLAKERAVSYRFCSLGYRP
jgi:hypothetical protein